MVFRAGRAECPATTERAQSLVIRRKWVYYPGMDKQTVTFRLGSKKVAALDKLADSMDRDRTYLLSEAVDAYLELQLWQLEQIRSGIAEADAGKLLPHSKVKAMAARWRWRK